MLRHAPVRIGEQGESEFVLVVEGLLPIHRIGADPRALGAEFAELGRQVTEMAAFDRSTRRHRLGVEEEDEGAVGE